MTTTLSSRAALLAGLMVNALFSSAQAQLTSPPTMVQPGGNFASVTVNSGGNLTFSNGSVGPTFPGTVTVNSGGTFTGTNLTLSPGGGQTGLTVNSNATASLLNSRMTVQGGGIGVNVVASAGGTATATITDTIVDLTSAGGGKGLIANGSEATLTLQGASSKVIASGGGGIPATDALSGGKITILDGASIDLESDFGNDQGLLANAGTINMTGGSVTLAGTGSGSGSNTGVQANNGSTVSLVGGTAISVIDSSGSSAGVSASASTVTMDGTTVRLTANTNGSSQNFGVSATNGAAVSMTGASVSFDAAAGGDHDVAVTASGLGTSFSADGTTITMTGDFRDTNSGGVSVLNHAEATVNNSTITVTTGDVSNFGLNVTTGAAANLTDTNITLNGTASDMGNNAGVIVQSGSSAVMNGGSITVTSSAADSAIQLTNGGTFTMPTGGAVQKNGSGGQAILVSGSGINTGTFNGVSLSTTASTGIVAQGSANSALNFLNGASLTPGNGLLLLDQSSGLVQLNGDTNVVFTGNIDATPASGSANVTLTNNSSLTGWINQNALKGATAITSFEGPSTADGIAALSLPKQNVNLLVDPSTWNMTASSTLNELEFFPGALINIGFNEAPGSFRTLVTRSLLGNGGVFGMNVDLPALQGDLLVVQTVSQGFAEHQLHITNLDQRNDPGVNKALLVVISAQTSGLEFPSNQVDAGTFKYKSRRGVAGDPVTPDPNNWYLVRTDTPGPTPPPTPEPTPVPSPSPGPIPTPTPGPSPFPSATPEPSPTPGPSATPKPSATPSPTPGGGEDPIDFPKPLGRADALTNTANAAIGTFSSLIPLFYADMQSLIERMGELRLGLQTLIAPPVPPSPKEVVGGKGGPESKEVIPAPQPSNEWGIWVRGFGTGMRISNDASRQFDQDVGGFQMGADRRFGSVLGGNVFVGVFGGYIYGSRDFNDGGTGSTNALSLGGYATWIHPEGWYVDVVGKYTQLWNYFNTPTLENTVATGYYNIPAVGGSLEVGRRYDFGRGCFFVEPEVQLAGVWEDGMSYNASNGLRVHGDSQTSLRGRIGGRLGMHLELSGGYIVEPYIKATADHEFLTGDTVRTNQTNFDPSISGTVGRFGAGVAARTSQSFYLYGEYDYATGDHIQEPWAVNLGLRWQW